MPFVNQEHRENPDPNIPGDRCYVIYKEIIEQWEKDPRWTTADRLLEMVMDLQHADASKACRRAAILAFMVFFVKEVMPYEDRKEKENGPITGGVSDDK